MRKFSLISVGAILITTLYGCGKPINNDENQEPEKQPFFIETQTVSELSGNFELKKTGKILGAQDIIVSSQASGRVSAIDAKIGDTIKNNSRVIALKDSNGIYTFSAQRANSAVTQAKLNYEQTMLSLDKAITDTSLAIEQAENQAKTNALGGNSAADLQLQQLETQLKKAKFDLETKKTSDIQTLTNFSTTSSSLITSVQLLYEDVLTNMDILLGVSTLNERANDSYEQYLGARSSSTKQVADNLVRSLLITQNQVDSLTIQGNASTLEGQLSQLLSYVEQLNPLLNAVDTMLQYTISATVFPESQLNGLKAQVNGFQSQVQGQRNSIIQQTNAINSFLSTYEQQQDSIAKSILALEQQIAGTKETLRSVEVNTGIGLENAQNSYNTTLKNKSTTEASLRNAITQAQIAANEAQNNLGKLSIEAPIEGTIGDILVDIGQEVAPGTPLFTISSLQNQQIEIALTSDQVERISKGQKVTIEAGGENYDGTLASLSDVSNATLGYKAIIDIDETTSLGGSVATVHIKVASDGIILPIKYVKILNKNQGQLSTLNANNSIEEKIITLGKVRGNAIEISGDINNETTVILSDVSNFDSNKFTLTKKNG